MKGKDKIKVISYCNYNGKKTLLRDLDEETREEVSKKLLLKYYSTAFNGKAEFWFEDGKKK